MSGKGVKVCLVGIRGEGVVVVVCPSAGSEASRSQDRDIAVVATGLY